jgi:hypothetical protein
MYAGFTVATVHRLRVKEAKLYSMKRIVASVGLVAVGASGLHAALLPSMTAESGKPWSVSATLRGFYDSNFNTVSDNQVLPTGYSKSTFGYEVSPAIQFSFPMEQTTLSFGYVYSLKWYENAILNTANDHIDQTSEFNLSLNHAFSERYSVNVKDSFALGQEPDMLRAGNTYSSFQYVSGDNMRNFGSIDFLAQLTPEFGLQLGYANTWYNYADDEPSTSVNANGDLVVSAPSNAGVLNELDNLVHLDGRYQLAPQTVGIVGYQFRDTIYTAGQQIGAYINPAGQTVRVYSDQRDAMSHYGYLGVDHNFRPDLTGSIKAGARYTDYYNDPSSQNDVAPYGQLSLSYTYLPESYVQVGAVYDYSSTSAFSIDPTNGDLTQNANAMTVFLALRHRIMPKLYGTLDFQWQNSKYYGGSLNNQTTDYYLVGLNLQYRFTPNFSAEIGYNYDQAVSDVDSSNVNNPFTPSYNRNRVYIGVTGSY